jgi:hypothetical protein
MSSRMAVYCSHQSAIFEWKLYTVVNDTGDDPVTLYYPYKPFGITRGTLRVAKGTVHAHLYMITLNVTLLNTWVYEPTYLMFIKSPPFAYIEGGYERNVQVLCTLVWAIYCHSACQVKISRGINSHRACSIWILPIEHTIDCKTLIPDIDYFL